MSDQPGVGEQMGAPPPQMTEGEMQSMMEALKAMGAGQQESEVHQDAKPPEQSHDEIMRAQQQEEAAMAEIQKQMAAAAEAAQKKDPTPVTPHVVPPPEKRGLIGTLFQKLKGLLLGIGRMFGFNRAPKMTASA